MQEYVNGSFVNNGFLLASNVELNDRYYYPSSDSGSVSRHPKMVIQYTLDLSPSPSPTGEGSPPPLRRETSPNGNSTRAKADGGDLSVTAPAAHQSAYGLNAQIDDTVILKAVDSSPADETRYRARFYFHPNSLAMGNNTSHLIFEGTDLTQEVVLFRLDLFYESGAYKLRPRVLKDNFDTTNGSKYAISNDWHVIEIDWNTSTAPGANNGYLSLWIDGALAGTIANVDNDTWFQRVAEVRLGATGGLDATTSGSVYFDNFESRRESYIGPISAPSTATPTPTGETSTPTPDLSPSPSPTGEGSPTPAPSATPTDTATPTITPTASTTLSASPTATSTPTITPTPTQPPVPVFSSADFTYDGDGRRVKSVVSTSVGSTTTFFVGAHYEVAGSSVTKYYFAGSQRIAMRKDTTLYYLLSDHLGSTSIVTDAAGTVVSQTRYKAWGEVRHQSGVTPTEYGFTGQYSHAADFGLMFYNARWYDVSLGRFAQADTLIGFDRYQYANNNPIRFIDPSGHVSCSSVAEDDCSFETMKPEEVIKRNIKSKFGITMSEESDIYNPTPKSWNYQNLQIIWKSLNQINDVALNGRLKELVGGATFKWGEYNGAPCSDGTGAYCGYTYGTTISFYNIGQVDIRQQNIFHEFGHLMNNSPGMVDVFSHDPGINNEDFLDDNGYLDTLALINPGNDMIQHPATVYNVLPGDMVSAQREHWGDMFANYVAGNIDLDSPEGRAMNAFVEGALCPYTGIPCP